TQRTLFLIRDQAFGSPPHLQTSRDVYRISRKVQIAHAGEWAIESLSNSRFDCAAAADSMRLIHDPGFLSLAMLRGYSVHGINRLQARNEPPQFLPNGDV